METINLLIIWVRYSDGILSIHDVWDADAAQDNSDGYAEVLADAKVNGDTLVTSVSIPRSAVSFALAADLRIGGGFVRTVWRIEDGDIDLVDGWDSDTASENEDGWSEVLVEGTRVVTFDVDLDAVHRLFDGVPTLAVSNVS